MSLLNIHNQDFKTISIGFSAAWHPFQPRKEPTAGNFQNTAHNVDWVGLLLQVNELKSHADSFAKKAAAFFNISRSISSLLFSL